jgi:DNA-directed RNA polymerase alpha subunit
LEEDGSWYSRSHFGPFYPGSRLQVATRLRCSLINDINYISITAVEIEGVAHEFSRLPGVHRSVVDLLLRFRKISLYNHQLKSQRIKVVPFSFTGPGIFYAKDIIWPNSLECRNPNLSIVTITLGRTIKGRFLIQEHSVSSCNLQFGQPFRLDKMIIPQLQKVQNGSRLSSLYPWLTIGFQTRPVERVGFRIECIGPLIKKNEMLILEIRTNGSISPQQALRQATIKLIDKFSKFVDALIPSSQINLHRKKKKGFLIAPNPTNGIVRRRVENQDIIRRIFYELFEIGCSRIKEPLGIDLRNFNLRIESYREMNGLAFYTLGQLLERLALSSEKLSPLLKKQRHYAFIKLKISPLLNYYEKTPS